MYIKGNISIDLKDTMIKIHPPKNFFGGVANLIKKGSWSANDECETFKIMALAQSIYRILRDMGVNNVVRVALGNVLIYEDLKNKPDDLELDSSLGSNSIFEVQYVRHGATPFKHILRR